MSDNRCRSHRARHTVFAMMLAAAVLLAGCDSDTYRPPTAPDWKDLVPQAGEARTVRIVAGLNALQGACLEGTVLFDGLELPDARTRCYRADGCKRLDLVATAVTEAGLHTVSLRVLDQAPEEVSYLAEATLWVTREGISLPPLGVVLEPVRATLRSGETVDFELSLGDFED